MHMHLLYPSNPFERDKPDDAYAEEYEAVQVLGLPCSLFSFESFEEGSFRARPGIPTGSIVVYRGWMLTEELYARLAEVISDAGSVMLTSVENYLSCHHMPSWVHQCKGLTPDTIVYQNLAAVEQAPPPQWAGFFVKDYVKSLGASKSLVKSWGDVPRVVRELKEHRGFIEGGICVRKQVDIVGDESRFFVINGVPVSNDTDLPPVVYDVARRIKSPFFSVDVAALTNRTMTVIELGDGQVSDRKHWPPDVFAKLLWALRHTLQRA